MKRHYTNRSYLEAINEKVIVFDGAMGTSLQVMGLTSQNFGGEKFQGCNDYLVISCPSAVEAVHRSFLKVGVDVIETNSFRANRITLGEFSLENQVYEINRHAATLAHQIADEFSAKGHKRFVAGSMGPTGKLPSISNSESSDIPFDEYTDIFRQQAIGLIEGGVDLLLLETQQDILEVKASIHGIHKAFTECGIFLPIQVQVTLDENGRMLLGTDITAVLAILEGMAIDVIGINCSTGPEQMQQAISYLGKNATMPISCLPNAGIPQNINGKAVYPLTPQDYAQQMTAFVEKDHVNIVGGCCGTTPEHLRYLVEQIHDHPSPLRPKNSIPCLSSAMQAIAMVQEPPPFLIGERLNTQGSRQFKELMLQKDYGAALQLARLQIDNGAHGLDICTALTENRDEAQDMQNIIKMVAANINAALIIDTTDPDVMEIALKAAPGRCLLNSVNLEIKQKKLDHIFQLAKRFNAAVIALTIDHDGMARTSKRKLEIAQKILEIATGTHALRPKDLVFDPLTFTLASGDSESASAAVETLRSIQLIKEKLPTCLTVLGISNVSYGLSPTSRKVLNSVFLYYAMQSGLDMAIVHPASIMPYATIPTDERKIAEELILNLRKDALKDFIEFFTSRENVYIAPKQVLKAEGLSTGERIRWRILHQEQEDLIEDIDTFISDRTNETDHTRAICLINEYLLPAMKEVGEQFGRGELILPFVLQSAEIMKAATSHLQQYLDQNTEISKGKIVLATVYGDVHDIGKNLVKTILVNNGFEVIDLGKQVPAEEIIQQAEINHADAIGLSALLVSTSQQMPIVVRKMHQRGITIPVLIGGAAVNADFANQIAKVDGSTYHNKASVYFCYDAFEALNVLERIKKENYAKNPYQPVSSSRPQNITNESAIKEKEIIRLSPNKTPIPPFWDSKILSDIPICDLLPFLNKKALFRLSWGARNARGKKWKQLEAEFEKRLSSMLKIAEKIGWLLPRAAYGYWPAQSDGDAIVIYDPHSHTPIKEITRLQLPRQAEKKHLCLADYFLPISSEKKDVIAFQVVTAGSEATKYIQGLNSKDNFVEAFYSHGLAVQIAESAARYIHNRIRTELNLQIKQGKRYSWGYEPIPDLSQHRILFDLLPAEKDLGMQLTSSYQLIPEHSTAALVVHHPQAIYFTIS
ncbi:MAG TPA: methionine synthase [Anaerolineae bacterium]|nr:methionine synthase [Anaerolineae bacterium]